MTRASITSTIFLVLAVLYQSAQALEISSSEAEGLIILSGEIVEGDFVRLKQFVSQMNELPSGIGVMDVSGGLVTEALEISEFISGSLLPVFIGGTCASACVFLVMAAQERYASPFSDGKIMLHRPFFEPGYFSSLSMSESAAEYEKLENRIEEFFEERKIPQSIRDALFDVPSNQGMLLATDTFLSRIGERHRPYEEWIIASCGHLELSKIEKDDLERMYFASKISEKLSGEKIPFENLHDLDRFNFLLDKQIAYSSCRQDSVREEQARFFREVNTGQ